MNSSHMIWWDGSCFVYRGYEALIKVMQRNNQLMQDWLAYEISMRSLCNLTIGTDLLLARDWCHPSWILARYGQGLMLQAPGSSKLDMITLASCLYRAHKGSEGERAGARESQLSALCVCLESSLFSATREGERRSLLCVCHSSGRAKKIPTFWWCLTSEMVTEYINIQKLFVSDLHRTNTIIIIGAKWYFE